MTDSKPRPREQCATKYRNYCRNCLFRGKCGRDETLPTANPAHMLWLDLGEFSRKVVALFFM